jgi:hypothetical protein
LVDAFQQTQKDPVVRALPSFVNLNNAASPLVVVALPAAVTRRANVVRTEVVATTVLIAAQAAAIRGPAVDLQAVPQAILAAKGKYAAQPITHAIQRVAVCQVKGSAVVMGVGSQGKCAVEMVLAAVGRKQHAAKMDSARRVCLLPLPVELPG